MLIINYSYQLDSEIWVNSSSYLNYTLHRTKFPVPGVWHIHYRQVFILVQHLWPIKWSILRLPTMQIGFLRLHHHHTLAIYSRIQSC